MRLRPAARVLLLAPPLVGLAVVAGLAANETEARAAKPAPRAAAERPNVIVVIADDLGYGDLGSYGSGYIKTPNIDALAKDGVRFTAGYVTHPVCAPSRAALMTGRYQTRFGYEFNPEARDEAGGMSLDETTMAQVMKSAGYRTGMIGKWHLGQAKGYYPSDRGFDEFFGIAAGGSTYILDPKPGDEFFAPPGADAAGIGEGPPPSQAPTDLASRKQRAERARQRFPITRNGEAVRVEEYLTDRFSREAVDFIDRHKRQPFFLYLAYNAPHTPLQATKKYVDRYRHIEDPGKRVYAAMVSAVDDGVGAIVRKLRAEGIDRRTLIVFTSDNGCAGYIAGACSNGPLSGYKGLHLEGGVRVPYIVAYPDRVPGGRVEARPVSTLDLLPTAAKLAGAELPAGRAYDGVDLMPLLAGKGRLPDRALFWRAGVTYAARDGDTKMWIANKAPPGTEANTATRRVPDGIPAKVSPHGRHVMMYDLAKDPAESRNLVAAQPAKAAALRAKIDAWDKNNVPPQWTSVRQYYDAHDGVVLQLYN